ncbi:MAG: hypothetical protein RLY20_3263 [Verrucomicrobiota bacterium]|jgi:hypothetical protein
MTRSRPLYCVAILFVIALGLLSRRFPQFLPAVLGKYPGDALWALMVFLGFGGVLRRTSTVAVALTALAFSSAIEYSQLYHAPWLDALRANVIGHLVLGSGFNWADLLAYAVGIAVGGLLELTCLRATHSDRR